MLLVLASLLGLHANTDPLLRLYAAVCMAIIFVANWATISEDLAEPERSTWQQGHEINMFD